MTIEQAQKAAKRFFEKNQYSVLDRCCANCRFSRHEYEGEIFCNLAEAGQDDWNTGDVDQYGLCDRFEEGE